MKPQNNLSLALTYAVPTAAALIGLLWLLLRTRDTDDDTATDSKKASVGETKTSGSLTPSRDRQSYPKSSSVCTGSGDAAARKDGSVKLLQRSPQVLKKQASDGDVLVTDSGTTKFADTNASSTLVASTSSSSAEVDRKTIADESFSTKSSFESISHSAKSASVSSPKHPAATTAESTDFPTDLGSSSNPTSLSSPRPQAVISDSGSSTNTALVSAPTPPAESNDSSSSVGSTSTLPPRFSAETSAQSGSVTKGDSVSPPQLPSASTEFISSTKAATVTPASVTVAGTVSGSRKDPVQVLVRQSEEKLKQDDAAIVQAKLSASTLQSTSNSSSKPGAATFASSIEITLSNASGKTPAPREVIQESFAQVACAQVLSSPQECLQPAVGKTENDQVSTESTDKKPTGEAQPDPAGSSTAKDSNSADSTISSQVSHADNSSTGADTNCNANSLTPTLSEVSKSKSETSSDVVGSTTKTSTVHKSTSDTSGIASNNSSPRLPTVGESESKTSSGASKSTTTQLAVSESKLDTSFDDSTGTSPRQPNVGESKAGISPRKSEPEGKTSKNLTKTKADSQNKTKETGKAAKASTVGNNVKTKNSTAPKESSSLEEAKRSSGSVAMKDIKSNQDSSQAKDKSSNKKGPVSASSSTQPAGSKVSPVTHSVKVNKSEKQGEGQSKALEQQKAPAPSNSYSSKRRTKSGSSTDGRTSQDKHDGMSAAMTVTENGRVPDSGSPICDTNSEASNDSGRGGSVGETLVSLSAGEQVCYEFNFPSELCGRLIGRGGKNIQQIKDQSGAAVLLTANPFTPDFQICRVQGVQSEVDQALMLIRKKFPLSQHPHLDMASLAPPPSPVVLPEIMQLNIPEGVSIDIVVSAIVNAGHIFVQQPTHPTFPSLERLNHFMNACYSDVNVPMLPRPVEGGIICAAESDGQWYRAQIVQVYAAQDECDIKYVDYGGYTRVLTNTLKQIRSDFMTLPFQAVECYLANITPLQEEEFFSDKASEVLGELTSGKMLQGQVIGRGDDSVCYVHLYQVSGHSVLMINREMVNREVVRWIEIL